LKVINPEPIRNQVYNLLRKEILDGTLKNGDRLLEQELAEKLGVSRTPVREAIRKLEMEGLVDYSPRKGVIIVGVLIEDAVEIYTIRVVLEGLAAILATKNINKDETNKLNQILKEMENNVKTKDIEKLIILNSKFHDSLAKYSKSHRLYQMIVSLREYVKKYATISYSLSNNLNKVFLEHKQIFEAMLKKDGDLAEKFIKNHIINAKKSFLTAMSIKSTQQ
jgi:DNA-binding GntR family transcriptional regulator